MGIVMNTINTSIDSDYMRIGATGHRKNICSLTHRRVVGIRVSFEDYFNIFENNV
jgi:hypothetical protein